MSAKEIEEVKSELGVPKRHLKFKSDFDLPYLKTFLAELFWLEIDKLMERANVDKENEFTYVILDGNNGLRYKRDVIDVTTQSQLLEETYVNFNIISISRNGVYHSLPEAMFHPLTLGHTYSTVDDIISEIKQNTMVTQQCKQFFALFDTVLFDYKAQLLNREMTWPYLQEETSIIELVQELFGHQLEHTYTQALILLTTVVFHEDIKCSFDLQAQLLSLLLNTKVEVREVPHIFIETPYATLGSNILGIDAGLMDPHRAELDDLLVEIWLNSAEEIDLYVANTKKQDYIRQIMACFDLTARHIDISYQINDGATERKLGHDSYLGINAFV